MNDDFVDDSKQQAISQSAIRMSALIDQLRERNEQIKQFVASRRSNAIDAAAASELARALPRGSHVLAISIQAHLLGIEVAATWRPIQSELFGVNYFFQMERAS